MEGFQIAWKQNAVTVTIDTTGMDDVEWLHESLERVKMKFLARKQEADWWDELTPAQQDRLEQAVVDAEKGENLLPHEQVMLEVEERLESLRRIQIEALARKVDFDDSILDLAQQINQDWWRKNKNRLLGKGFDRFFEP